MAVAVAVAVVVVLVAWHRLDRGKDRAEDKDDSCIEDFAEHARHGDVVVDAVIDKDKTVVMAWVDAMASVGASMLIF